jgi:hypothetical protein
MCSKAIEMKWNLQQGDCENTFYHAKLQDNELTVVSPAVGDWVHSHYEYWWLNKHSMDSVALHTTGTIC